MRRQRVADERQRFIIPALLKPEHTEQVFSIGVVGPFGQNFLVTSFSLIKKMPLMKANSLQ